MARRPLGGRSSNILNDLEIAALHIDGQSIYVDAPPDIINVVDEDDDIIDEEDPIPHNLADSDDEDLINLDIDDGVNVVYSSEEEDWSLVMSADVAWGHGGDGGVKGTRKPNLGGRRAGRLHTRQETQNLRRLISQLPCGAALGVACTTLSLWGAKWRPGADRRRGQGKDVGHLQKIYNGMKDTLKERYWIPDSDGTYDLERIRQTRPSHISEVDWDAQIAFWNDPKNLAWATQNKQNRAKSKVMESSTTREYLSLIHTFFLTHTVGDVFLNLADKALYDEMLRLQGLGSNTPSGVPYTEDEIMAIVHGGKSDDKFSQMLTQLESQPEYSDGSGSGGCGDDEPGDDKDGGEDEEDEDDS
ncbi:hypothetical protein Tco_1313048 [Tanacetum coccineum]